jgi:hypothetical protein
MRSFVQKRIDALHAEIARLVKLEKDYHDRKHPEDNSMWRHVAHAQIEVAAWPPERRKNAQLEGTPHA